MEYETKFATEHTKEHAAEYVTEHAKEPATEYVKEHATEYVKEHAAKYVTGKIAENLKSKKALEFFENLCAIPHGSSDTKRISDYCVEFAKVRNLRYIQDESNNVIIFKPAAKGRENDPTIIIQGHLDMVCEKEKGCDIDFKNDGLKLYVDGDYLKADGTTLGGDDGIAVAMALAILDSDNISHPDIEAVFTVDEEIGMLGAAAMDCSPLKGKLLLNLDSENEGRLLVSCAGGATATVHIPVDLVEVEKKISIINVVATGMQGGHSGVEIDKGRANSNMIMGRVLYMMTKEFPDCELRLMNVNGGLKDNAIPRETVASLGVLTSSANLEKRLSAFTKNINDILKNEFAKTDSDINIEINFLDMDSEKITEKIADKKEKKITDKITEKISDKTTVFSKASTDRAVAALYNLPGGIVKMSRDIEGLVQTSLNMGILKTIVEGKDSKAGVAQGKNIGKENPVDSKSSELSMSFSVRSSVKSEKEELINRLSSLAEILGGCVTCQGDYPAWEYKKDSVLRDTMVEVFCQQYGKEPVIEAIHAGVECGLFAGKINGLDCISIGPDMLDIHTPKERLSISSVERTWKYVLGVLEEIK